MKINCFLIFRLRFPYQTDFGARKKLKLITETNKIHCQDVDAPTMTAVCSLPVPSARKESEKGFICVTKT